jgi:hypothetical protein
MGAGPSGGALKKMFNPANMKKKMKNAVGVARPGGNKTSRSEGKMMDSGGKKPRMFNRSVD